MGGFISCSSDPQFVGSMSQGNKASGGACSPGGTSVCGENNGEGVKVCKSDGSFGACQLETCRSGFTMQNGKCSFVQRDQDYKFLGIHRGFFMGCGINLDTSVSCWSGYYNFWSSAFGYDGRPPGKTVFRYPTKLPKLTNVVQLASGYDKHCALLVNGSISCWGPNDKGLIPNSSSRYLTEPTTLTGVTDAVQIAVGHADSCAVLKSGKVMCWGFVVGDGITDEEASKMYYVKSSPVEIQGLQDMVEISMGVRRSCGRDIKGQVICWNNFPTRVNAERKVLPLPMKAKNISMSDSQLCVAFEDGSAQCLDKANIASSGLAVSSLGDLSKLKKVQQIVAGDLHSCALLENARVYCWGANSYGALEHGLFNKSDLPVLIEGISDVVQLSIGNTATCALDKNHHAYCWGDDESWGEGVFGRNYAKIPTLWSSQVDIKSITQWRLYNGCQLEDSGTVNCWGWNRFGALGVLPFAGLSAYKTKVNVPPAKALVRAQYGLACTLSQTNEAWCWGSRSFNIGDQALPFRMPALDGATAFSSGLQHICAIKGGKVYCFGKNHNGQLGDGTTNDSIQQPVEVQGISGVTAIWSNDEQGSNCAKAADGVYCWGSDLYDHLPFMKSYSLRGLELPQPKKVEDWGEPIEFVAVGREVVCLADIKGSIRCTGRLPSSGYTGKVFSEGPRHQRTYTIQKLKKISAGGVHVCALTKDNSVYCWGKNESGQLGDNTDIDRAMPTQIIYPEDIVDIVAQVECTFARGISGRWYFNGRCQTHR